LIESTDNNFYEQHELRENLACIHNLIEEYQPTEVIMLDLHTTSSFGGIFSIVTNDQQSINIAKAFHAPVITGFMEILKGTTLHYFSEDTLHLPTVALTFESGQHEEKLSINRAIAGIVNCLKVIGMVEEKHVENIHDKILIDYSNDLPKVVHLIECHSIESDDQFVMKDGYVNFQKVHKGEHLADDKHGPIHAKEDALILMPLYQKQGEDGFFLVQETS
jgi:succinylglutamate desuccinylase